jgi:hypothetical protein
MTSHGPGGAAEGGLNIDVDELLKVQVYMAGERTVNWNERLTRGGFICLWVATSEPEPH